MAGATGTKYLIFLSNLIVLDAFGDHPVGWDIKFDTHINKWIIFLCTVTFKCLY